mmetsp:Transcript_15020/g.41350  ORF Transcript_15020/g.41350 Transcript_15020/m.41350 type:complete len:322 (-) Transcript_15020:430-1395(-)
MLRHGKDSEPSAPFHDPFPEGWNAEVFSECLGSRRVTNALHHLKLHPLSDEAFKSEQHVFEPPEIDVWVVPRYMVRVLQLLGPMTESSRRSDLRTVAVLFLLNYLHQIPCAKVLHGSVTDGKHDLQVLDHAHRFPCFFRVMFHLPEACGQAPRGAPIRAIQVVRHVQDSAKISQFELAVRSRVHAATFVTLLPKKIPRQRHAMRHGTNDVQKPIRRTYVGVHQQNPVEETCVRKNHLSREEATHRMSNQDHLPVRVFPPELYGEPANGCGEIQIRSLIKGKVLDVVLVRVVAITAHLSRPLPSVPRECRGHHQEPLPTRRR